MLSKNLLVMITSILMLMLSVHLMVMIYQSVNSLNMNCLMVQCKTILHLKKKEQQLTEFHYGTKKIVFNVINVHLSVHMLQFVHLF